MMGTSGIVGPCILQAAGAGYSFKLLESDRVAVAFFGDGAVNNGAFHEGPEHGQHLEAAGAVRLREQRVRHRGPVPVRQPATPASPAGRSPTACPASRSTATMSWPSTRPRRRPSRAPGAAAARRLIECKTYRTRPHAEGMGDYTVPDARGRRALEDPLPDPAAPPDPRRGVDRRRGRAPAIDEEVESEIVAAIAVRRVERLARSRHGRRSRLRRAGRRTEPKSPSATRRRRPAAAS